MSKTRRAGVYLASANWDRITAWVAAAIAGGHYISPWLASVIVPALLHHWAQALFAGRQALAAAASMAKVEEYARAFGQRMGVDESDENEEGK